MSSNPEIANKPAVELTAGQIQVAFEKLFGGGRGVKKFARSGVRYVDLASGTILVEQNPNKNTKWARMSKEGHRIAWAMKDGKYLARVIDNEVIFLEPSA